MSVDWQAGRMEWIIGPGWNRGAIHVIAGFLLGCISIFGLWKDIAWVAQPFYVWAWWGYILLLDGIAVLLRNDSLLTRRLCFFFPICIWSNTFWFFFELINARIKNWYYVGVFPQTDFVYGAVFTILAFSTVFMGIFQTYDVLTATGLWKGRTRSKRQLPWWVTYVLQAAGIMTGSIALAFPHYLAPLIWGSFTLIVDPWNYRRGSRSLLRDLEHGDYGLIGRLLLAGLIAGVVWESLNFFAPQKWIYTVRGLEEFKLFEMPLLGFVGFPALALDSMAAFSLLSSFFLGNRSWERPEDLSYTLRLRKPASGRAFWTAVVVQMMFWGVVSALATPVNVGSLKVELRHLNLSLEEIEDLNKVDLTRPRQLLRASDTLQERQALLAQLQWDTERFQTVRNRAALYTFKGIGIHFGWLLESMGIHHPQELAQWDPQTLHHRLTDLAQEKGMAPPRLDFVRVWVLAAREFN